MTVQEMKEHKKALGLSNIEIAKRSGVSLGTVQKVFSGESRCPRYKTLIKLEKAFNTGAVERENAFIEEWSRLCKSYLQENGEHTPERMVAEPVHAYRINDRKVQIHTEIQKGIGPYTLEDYMNLPDDVHVELIDGYLYDMASSSTLHQQLSLEIALQLKDFVRRNKGSCIPFVAPADVQLDNDDKTILVPDVFVVCDRNKITKPRIIGAPDMVIEVLSPSGWQRDMILKLRKYREAGVREYWVILPEQKIVYVYVFENGADPEMYTFEDKVPVVIWAGKCTVDFKEIFDTLSFMYK